MEKIFSLISTNAYADLNTFDVKPDAAARGGLSGLANIEAPRLLQTVISMTLIIAAIVAFFFLVFGGIKWITSGGDKDSTAKAQGTITAALIGLAIVFSAWAIMKIIEVVFGVSILQGGFTLPTVAQ